MEKLSGLTMKTKEIIGTLIFGLSIGAGFYLFFGYVKPRIDVNKEKASLLAKK